MKNSERSFAISTANYGAKITMIWYAISPVFFTFSPQYRNRLMIHLGFCPLYLKKGESKVRIALDNSRNKE